MSKINPDNAPIYQELVDTLFALNCAISQCGDGYTTVRYAISDDGLTLYKVYSRKGQPAGVELQFTAPIEMILNAVQALHKSFS